MSAGRTSRWHHIATTGFQANPRRRDAVARLTDILLSDKIPVAYIVDRDTSTPAWGQLFCGRDQAITGHRAGFAATLATLARSNTPFAFIAEFLICGAPVRQAVWTVSTFRMRELECDLYFVG